MRDTRLKRQAAEILLRAADYIRRYGWQEEGMGKPGAPRCSMGALDSACPRGEWDPAVAELLYETLNGQLGGLSLTQYNHKFLQSGENVARLYERTAKALANG
ncbi:MAG TPA: hypothetical protein VLG27_04755 [Candidatus Saccharimonadia bacterium]|nr:hypothetical protein [Candidatus Saccharimonadia bacterium]